MSENNIPFSPFNSLQNNKPAPSFQESQAGPWGQTLNGVLARQSELNVPFDQLQYENAKMNGCIPPPCKPLPSWPPPPGTGFIYPSMEKEQQNIMLGDEKGCFQMAAPFVNSAPKLPDSTGALETFNGRGFS